MNPYARFLWAFAGASLTVFLLQCILFWACLGYPAQAPHFIEERFFIKESYANSVKGRKIVVASGSNTFCGVNAAKMEEELGVPVVNYGMTISLQYYTLARLQKSLHQGDIVILPLEYAFYTYNKYQFEEEALAYITGYDKNFFLSMPPLEKINFIFQWSPIDLLRYNKEQILLSYENSTGYPKDKYHLNINGDTINYPTQKSSQDLMDSVPVKVFQEKPVTLDAKNELKKFIVFCQENGITVLAAWPNFLWNNDQFPEDDAQGIMEIEKFFQDNQVEILGSYTDCIYDVKFFSDSRYHLNEAGREIHTKYLIDKLKDKL